jgi:hypothetical protein
MDDVTVPENYFLSTYDINIIISNLLENAICGSENSKEKMLSLNMNYTKSLLYIS